jgi:membrane-associated protein
VVRTLVHPAAGLLGMPTAPFTLWQSLAGIVWSQSLVLAGYVLGESGRHGVAYLTPAIGAVVAAGLLPPAIEWLRTHRAPSTPAEADRDAPAADTQAARARPQAGATSVTRRPPGR